MFTARDHIPAKIISCSPTVLGFRNERKEIFPNKRKSQISASQEIILFFSEFCLIFFF